ncbi:unnamed protein product [Rotaria sp. Silwood1]|nr:unnamed protein product [Rotaria sp. Silwood1]
MAYQHDQKHEKQGCIQLVRCIPPTDEELKNPQYVPQLEINSQAQQILAERFEAPISIIVYVGNMGVGKSKLATVTVAALEKETPGTDLLWFRSGAGTNGVTQGVWMWSEPLRHPDQDEKTKGSILILDCEGTDNLDENTGANLYFFCMVVSTAFAVVLRPARIDRFQCDRLYHALNRFEVMKSLHVLPNIWLLPLDLPKFLHIDRDTGDDIEISKDEWLHQIFSVDEERNNLSSGHNQRLKEQYEYITHIYLHDPSVDWDSLIGSDAAKRTIKEEIVYPIRVGINTKGKNKKKLSFLGKTVLTKAVATECKTTFFNISALTIAIEWLDASENLVRVLFEAARFHASSALFFG